MFVCLGWLYHHMLSVSYISQESWVLFLLLLCSLVMCANNWVCFGPMVILICLHFTLPHHYADVAEGIKLLKCLSGIFCLEYASKINQFSQLSFMQWGCVYSAYPFFIWQLWEYVYFILSSSSIRSLTHLPLFRVGSWNNGMCCISLYILIYWWKN